MMIGNPDLIAIEVGEIDSSRVHSHSAHQES